MHLGFIIRIYHDARSPERQKSSLSIKRKRVVSNEVKISFSVDSEFSTAACH